MLDFEQQVLELEGKIEELRHVASSGDDGNGLNIADEIARMEEKIQRLLTQIYSKLTPAQKVKVARHQNRPHFKDYIKGLIVDFVPLAGDRTFGEDHALQAGFGRFQGQTCAIIGQEKGDDTESRIKHNFGMARPEGYRKAMRIMALAERYNVPVLTFVDTAGAYPGVGAEERGQSEAIAKSIQTCLNLKVPIVSTIIGEGGSGGAIAIAAADEVYMLEHSIYSVISPEGCASILWRSAEHADEAATALKLTAQDMQQNKLIDGIIKEGLGGAHRNQDKAVANVGDQLAKTLQSHKSRSAGKLVENRREKYLAMGRAA